MSNLARSFRGIARWLVDLWGLWIILIGWQLIVSVNSFNVIVLPSPLDVLSEIVTHPVRYGVNLFQTTTVGLIGLAIGLAVGTLLAIACWASRILEGLLTPLSLVFASVPVVTLIPIISRIFGYNIGAVLCVVAVFCFFPTFIFTSAGLRATPPGTSDVFTVFGAHKFKRLLLLAIPSALPHWIIAFRLAAANAVLGAMTAEFLLMSSGGLGSLLYLSGAQFNASRAIGASAVATVVSVCLFVLAVRIERRITERWT